MFWIVLLTTWFLGDLVWLWWSDRQLRRMAIGGGWRIASAGFTLAMLGSVLWWILARSIGLGMDLPRGLLGLVMVWHLVVMPIALVGLILWGGLWSGWGVARWLTRREPAEPEAPADQPVAVASAGGELAGGGPILSRRHFLGVTAAAMGPLVTMGSTGVGMYQLSGFRVRKLIVPVPNLPPALEGMTIAHVSDTHVGRFTHGNVLRKIADVTSTLDDGKPCDLVLMTGDLINSDLEDAPAAIDMIKRMGANSGVFLVEGNHDLFEGWRPFDRMLLDADLNLLLNEGRTVEVRGQAVQVLGLIWGPPNRHEWGRYGGDGDNLRRSFEVAARQRDLDAFPILLAHHPHALDLAAAANIPLTLAGHTHGGQLMITENIGPGPLMYRYWSGLYRKSNGCSGVVSNGVGNWFPLRVNAPAELLHLTLTADRRVT